MQDVGYLSVLDAYGVPDASGIAPAFILLKRMKEAFWIAFGFLLLARSGPVVKAVVRQRAQADSPAT